jgi:hypothetical protein
MTEETRSASAIVEEWLLRAESVASAIPSWIPSPRHEVIDLGLPLATIESALARASVAPLGFRSSLLPLSEARLSIAPDIFEAPAYPDLREENQALRRQLAEMAVSMAQLRADVLQASEGELVGLACAVAERVTGSELRTDPTLVVAWAREAIEALGAIDDVVIAVAPGLAELLPPTEWVTLIGKTCRIETDPSLAALGCEVRTRASVIDASPQGRLGAVARELGVGRT